MSRDGRIELLFPDERRLYRLRVGELRQLQEKCGDRGPLEILSALTNGKWKVDDIIQPIRLGLIGGGMKLEDANRLVESTVHDGTFGEAAFFAIAILGAAITGPPDEKIKMPKGANAGKMTTPTNGSGSASSTGKGPFLGGRRHRSTNSAGGNSARR
jgi:hypothetical protein